MSTLYVDDIINDCLKKLSDEGADHFDMPTMLAAFNEAAKLLVLVKPDAYGVETTALLVEGTLQSLSGDGFAFLEPICNMGADGATVGRAILTFVKKKMDQEDPYWHMNDASAEVTHIAYDPKTPRHFYTLPPQPSSDQGYIKYIQAESPPDVTTGTGGTYHVDSGFAPVYKQPLCNLTLFSVWQSLTTAEARAKSLPYYQLAVAQLQGHEIHEENTNPSKEE